jgi:hypothetical protein
MRVDNVERSIRDVEGFDVTILHPDGTDVQGNKTGLPPYKWKQQADKNWTVKTWKDKCFTQNYAVFDVAVLDGDGQTVYPNTRLKNVRASY